MMFSPIRQLVQRMRNALRRGRPSKPRPGRKPFRPWLDALEDRCVPAMITWGNPLGGDFGTASNWVGNVLPGPNDTAVIPNGPNGNGIVVTYNGTMSSDTLVVGNLSLNGSNSTLDLVGGTLHVSGTLSETGTDVNHQFTTIVDGGTLFAQAALNLNLSKLTVNSGALMAPGAVSITNGSTFTLNSGAITYATTLQNSTLNLGPSISGTATFICQGSCTLNGNVPAGVTLWVQGSGAGGNALLTIAANLTNSGTLQMESINSNWNSNVAVADGATLTNAPGGVIQSNLGTGGTRSLTGTLDNQGQMNAGTGGAFAFTGTYLEDGGSIGGDGDGAIYNSQVRVLAAPPAAAPTLKLRGACTLLTNNLAGTTLWVQGTSAGGNALLTIAANLTNYGTLQMESANSNWGSNVAITGGGTFTNAAGGVIAVNAGTGGSRFFTGELINAGTVNVGTGFSLGGTSGTEHHVNAGVIQLNSATMTVRGNSFVNQSQGLITGTGTLDFTQQAGELFTNLGTIEVPGGNLTVSGLPGQFVNFHYLDSTLVGGTYDLTGTLRFNTNGASIVTNAANIILGAPSAMVLPLTGSTSALTNFAINRADGSITINSGSNFTTASGVTVFDNEGALTVGQSSTFRVQHDYTQGATATLVVDRGRMRIDGVFNNAAGGTLTRGQYQIIGTDPVNIGVLQFNNANLTANAATLELDGPDAQILDETSPTPLDGLRSFANNSGSFTIAAGRNFTTGDLTNNGTLTIAPGIFTVNGNYSQGAAGVLNVALDGTSPVNGYGQLQVSGPATLAAGASLNTTLGFVSDYHDTFTVLSASGGVNGTFNNLPDGATFVLNGERFRANYPTNAVVLTHFANVATHLNFQEPVTVTAGVQFQITVQAVDNNNQVDTGYTGTIHFTATNGAMANAVFQPTDMGQRTFIITLRQAGTLGVTGTDTVTGITGMTSFTITPAAADHLVFLQPPTDTAAGQTMSPVVVAVVDQFGNVETGDNSDVVTLSIGTNAGGGTLSGTLTMTVMNGMATFSDLSISAPGMGYTLHASIGGSLPDIDSNPFNITP
jgi:hypothetical protein